jgi:hypothetical protein
MTGTDLCAACSVGGYLRRAISSRIRGGNGRAFNDQGTGANGDGAVGCSISSRSPLSQGICLHKSAGLRAHAKQFTPNAHQTTVEAG